MDNNIGQVKDIESALIGAVLRDGAIFERVRDIVSVDDFGVHAFSHAWRAMQNLYDLGMGIDVFTVADELERIGKMNDFSSANRQGRALLTDLRRDGHPKNVLSYAESVQDYATKRRLEPFLLKWENWRRNGRRGKDIIRDIQTELNAIKLYSQQDEYTVPFSVAVSEAYDAVDMASRGENIGVRTGLIDLDTMIGSLMPQNLYIIAARPGQGKTALMLTIALNAARAGKKVAIFSLEMSRAQVAQRLISQWAGIDLNKIMMGKLEESDWPVFVDAVEHVAALPITINDLSSIRIDEISDTARKMDEVDLVIVDYIQLTDSGKKSERRELDVSAISRGLKYLANELKIPVLAASQLSREIEKRAGKKPVLSDLRESGSLEQDAYAVMFIHYPDELIMSKAQIILAKHRNGPLGTIDLYFRGELTRFESATTRMMELERI